MRGTARLSRARRTVRRVLRSRWDLLLVIALGGAVGSLARWGLSLAWPTQPGHLPWATVVANLSGCLFLGVLIVLVLEVLPTSRYVRPFLGTGVLGGYTTFSTAMLDVRTQLVGGHPGSAGAYLAGSLVFGLVAVWLGMVCARLVLAGARNGLRRGR
jgi:fluoride exporter